MYEDRSKVLRKINTIYGYKGQIIKVRQTSLYLQISSLPPHCFLEYISPIHEYILGMGVLQDLDPGTTTTEFRLHIL